MPKSCEWHAPYSCEEMADIAKLVSKKVNERVERRIEGHDVNTLEQMTIVRCEGWLVKSHILHALSAISAGYMRKVDTDEFAALIIKTSDDAMIQSFKHGIHMAASYG